MNTYTLYWAPTGQPFAVVQARTPRAAVRKAPAPQRRYLGEVYAVEEPMPLSPSLHIDFTMTRATGVVA